MTDDEDRWADQFRFDHNGRRLWEPDQPPPRSPTEAELDDAQEELARRGRIGT
jgi:hypothetical protein